MACIVDRLVGGEQFKLLSAVVETKSFSKAAAALGVTQPSVSQSVKRLETIVGKTLFRRSSRGAELTAHGEAVIMYVRAMQALTEDLQRYFDNATEDISICVGMSEDFVRTALPSILWLFMRDHPRVDVRLLSGSYEFLTNAIETRSANFVVMRRYTKHPTAQLLWTEPATWVGSADLPKPLPDPVPLVLPIAPNPVRETLTGALASAGRTWRVRFESPSVASIEAAMQAGFGICGAPRSMRLYGVDQLDATVYGLPPLPEVEFVMTEVDRQLTGPVAAFAELLRQLATASYRRAPSTSRFTDPYAPDDR